MGNNIISAKHQEFIRLVAKGVNNMEAYKSIQSITKHNQSITKGTAKAQGSKLAKKYALEIQQAKEKDAKLIEGVKDNETLKTALNGILSQAEADLINSKILNGTLEVEKIVIIAGKAQKIMVKPSHSDISSAYDAHNKRFGSNAPVKTEVDLTANKIIVITPNEC